MMSFAAYLFAGVAVLMLILALAWIGPRLFSTPGVRSGPDREATNLDIYRDELTQLTLDHQCGRLSTAALEEARTELSRRLLDDTNDHEAPLNVSCVPAQAVGITVMVLMPLLAGGLYWTIGSASALNWNGGSANALKDVADNNQRFYQQLQEHLRDNPRDARAWVALGRYEMKAHRFKEAEEAFESGIKASPKVAADAAVLCELAEAIGISQGRTYKGRPRELVEKALALAPNNAKALEMAGSAAYEALDYVAAATHWKMLRSLFPEDSHEHHEIGKAVTLVETESRLAPLPAVAEEDLAEQGVP